MLRAIIFDFDGVLVNSEPLILKLTQQMAGQEGWAITGEEYYRDYLALDDRGIVEHLYRSHGRILDQARQDQLVLWKARAYAEIIREGLPPFPGAVGFVQKMAGKFPLAIASGSLRAEIEHLLDKMGLRHLPGWISKRSKAHFSKCQVIRHGSRGGQARVVMFHQPLHATFAVRKSNPLKAPLIGFCDSLVQD